ncbi:hypothetical protein N0V85_002393 [Neurospora sp. IMI 360204]|nr:hypothetical protein N0V85_002393 [Neurospora sp. IMI 360204]
MSSTPPGHHGAVSHDDYGSVQQPVSQHGDKIALDDAEHSVGHSSQSNITAYNYDIVYNSHHNDHLHEDWNEELATYLDVKNFDNPPPQPPVELRPPPEAIRKFTSLLISQHFPAEITPESCRVRQQTGDC